MAEKNPYYNQLIISEKNVFFNSCEQDININKVEISELTCQPVGICEHKKISTDFPWRFQTVKKGYTVAPVSGRMEETGVFLWRIGGKTIDESR